MAEPLDDPNDIVPKTVNNACAWCGRHAWFRLRAASWAGKISFGGSHDEREFVAAIYQCGGCQRPSLFTFQAWSDYGGWGHALLRVYPSALAQPLGDLPEEVEADRLEAWNCFHGGQNRAAVLMARAALQRAVRILGADRGGLHGELESLVAKGTIVQQLRENSEEVRLSGNDAAHPEELGAVTEQDARDSLAFLDDFLETTLAIRERQRKRKERRDTG